MDYSHDKAPEMPEGSLVLGTTAIKTREMCERKYASQYVYDLPELRKQSFTIGSVVHAVCERWLLCPGDVVPQPREVPDQPTSEFGAYAAGSCLFGQVPGTQVNLFPPGWTKVKERDGSWVELATNDDIALARDLAQAAIDSGILTRYPDGRVERKFWIKILSNLELRAAGFDTVAEVWATSLIDFSSVRHGILEDHKTSAGEKYLLDAQQLQENGQMLLYAYVLFRWMEDIGNPSDTIRASHNQFVKKKNPKTGKYPIRKTTTTISKKQANVYFKKLKAEALEIFRLHMSRPALTTIPMTESACGAYGGCAYNNICLGIQTPDQYKADVAQRLLGGVYKTFDTKPTHEETMNQLPFAQPPQPPQPYGGYAPAPMQAPLPMQQQPQAPPPQQQQWAPPPAPAPQPQPPGPNLQTARGNVPWAAQTCALCGGLGLSSTGDPCPMCLQLLPPSEVGRHPAHFQYGFDYTGTWRIRKPEAPTQAPAPPQAPPPQQAPQMQFPTPPAQAPAAAPAAPPQGETTWEPVEPPEPADATPEGVAKKRKRRTKAEMAEDARKALAAQGQPLAPVNPEPPTIPQHAPVAAAPSVPESQATGWLRGQLDAILTVPAGRPSRAGMILLVDCVPQTLKSGPRPVTLGQILVPLRAEYARAHGMDYWMGDAFKRREWVAQFAPNIAEVFHDGIVEVASPRDDYENGQLINALMGHASFTFRGVR